MNTIELKLSRGPAIVSYEHEDGGIVICEVLINGREINPPWPSDEGRIYAAIERERMSVWH